MITLDATALTQITSPERGIAMMLAASFTSGTVYLTNWPQAITASDGNTYTAVGDLIEVRNLAESEDRSAKTIQVALNIVNTGMIALAIGSPAIYRRQRLVLSIQLINNTFQPVGNITPRWSGYMDQMSIERTPPTGLTDTKGGSGKIIMKCSRAGVPMSKRDIGLRSTHQQQLALYPGDYGLEFQQNLIEMPALWLSKAFQAQ